MRFILSTGNANKVKEFNNIFVPMGIEVVALSDTGLLIGMPDENGDSFEENAEIKALEVYNVSGQASIADDSGLEVDALDGAPGIYSSRYAGEGASDKDRIDKLLFEMRYVPESQRTARFVCAICCILPGGEKIFSRGECEGRISFEIKGNNGFGYDPIFIANNNNRTFGEMSKSEKDKISHRGLAIRNLYSLLQDKIKYNL